tara:strand:+ start:356 stop:943 length:588 start_codon:yes stop_codon:yes gene_type:complete
MSTEENVSVITPMVEYENETIWEDKVLIMIHNLSDVINKTISNDDYDMLFFKNNNYHLNYSQRKVIIDSIIKGLVSLSNDIKWSTKHAYIVIRHIDSILYSFNYIGPIFNLTKQTLSELIFRNIVYYIGYDENDIICDGIIEYIPLYRCAKCLHLKHFIVSDNILYDDKNICFNCDNYINSNICKLSLVLKNKYK